MRQIEMIGYGIRRMLALKGDMEPSPGTQIEGTEEIDLELTLERLLRENQINEAENRLFERLDEAVTADKIAQDASQPVPNETPRLSAVLMVAVRFYEHLAVLSDEALRLGGFTREEITQGLEDISRKADGGAGQLSYPPIELD